MEGKENTHFIGDIASQLGVSQRTIRYYEELGLIKPTRTSGGFRVYADSEVERLKTILLLKDLGMSLEEIGSLIKVRHEGIPSEVTPKLMSMLMNRRSDFKTMIKKYQMGMDQLDKVLSLLSRCTKCGHIAEEKYCEHCLEERDEEVPPLMKTLL
jgi:DNA-binding transcriptional MerR regulator